MPARKTTHVLAFSVLCLTLLGGAARADTEGAQPPQAFPGAEGFGATTPGGRGGRIFEVTHLEDGGPGSFRAACEAEGARFVVFRTGGTIELTSPLQIRTPHITVAGQTAPGGGVTVKGGPFTVDGTHDVVLRFLRVRPGPAGHSPAEAMEIRRKADVLKLQLQEELGKDWYREQKERRKFKRLGTTCGWDGLMVIDSHDVVLDHCSVSWSVDETVEVIRSRDVTVQWCIISEALHKSIHFKGSHGLGLGVGGPRTYRVSLHHNLLAHNSWRNPRLNPYPRDGSGVIHVVNNVIYNTGGYPDTWSSGTRANVIGNTWIPGPSTAKDFHPFTSWGRVYVKGNIAPQRPSDDLPEDLIVVRERDKSHIVEQRFDAPPVTAVSAIEARRQVLARAGAWARLDAQGNWVANRDPVDDRVAKDVDAGTGKHIDHPAEVGGWPDLAAGTPYADSDHDGMPDAFERKHGLNPNDPADGPRDADGDCYTNVEEFLNGSHPRVGEEGLRAEAPRF
ncbi:MAG: hypothetical protein JXR37_05690 [Kiritimatiellae bacterium]|nr:hypothetical protein [Kiritimatiellia bacterium]